MTGRTLKAAIVPTLLLVIACSHAIPAVAADMDFCSGSRPCKPGDISNESAAVVTAVTVTQLNDDACAAVKKRHTKNLKTLDLLLKPACTYKVTFETTKGCTGDKVGKITPDNIANGRTRLDLVGGCGTLQVKQTKY